MTESTRRVVRFPPMNELSSHTSETAVWLELMRAGDREAITRLIEHSCERLRWLTRRMLRRFPQVHRWEETDDVFCEGITKLHRALETVQPESSKHFYNLAATQMRRVLVDFARRYYGAEGIGAHHETAHVDPDSAAPPKHEVADSQGEPASLVEWTEFHQWIETLPQEEREVFDLVWYQQLTHDQAAAILGVAARTVRRRWQDVRFKLCKARLGESLPE